MDCKGKIFIYITCKFKQIINTILHFQIEKVKINNFSIKCVSNMHEGQRNIIFILGIEVHVNLFIFLSTH